mgnify:CR=1 FL=1
MVASLLEYVDRLGRGFRLRDVGPAGQSERTKRSIRLRPFSILARLVA